MTKFVAVLLGVPGVGKSTILSDSVFQKYYTTIDFSSVLKHNVKKSGKKFSEVYTPKKIAPYVEASWKDVFAIEAENIAVATHASVFYQRLKKWGYGLPLDVAPNTPSVITVLEARPSLIGDRRAKDTKPRNFYPKISRHLVHEHKYAQKLADTYECAFMTIENKRAKVAAKEVFDFFEDVRWSGIYQTCFSDR